MANKLFQHGGEAGIQETSIATIGKVFAVEMEVKLLVANSKTSGVEKANAKMELDNLHTAAVSFAERIQATLSMVRERRQRELDSVMTTVLWVEAAIAKMRKVASAEVVNVRSDLDSVGACHHDFLASICRIVDAREMRKDVAGDTIAK